ncbi:MAG: hypothetical protein JWR35_2698 [Marmoricola sp.]|jgi:hypothetical protein|nr:hypothetical protein [Marmoricola sp.]
MNIEHRGPLVAFVAVGILCATIATNSTGPQALQVRVTAHPATRIAAPTSPDFLLGDVIYARPGILPSTATPQRNVVTVTSTKTVAGGGSAPRARHATKHPAKKRVQSAVVHKKHSPKVTKSARAFTRADATRHRAIKQAALRFARMIAALEQHHRRPHHH